MLITTVTTGAPFGLLPRLGGSTLAALLLLGVCVLASVWLGRRTPTLSRWPKRLVGVSAALLAVFAFAGFVDADDRLGRIEPGYQPAAVSGPTIEDIFVYDSAGRLVEDAWLFDQDGNPIRLGYPGCPGEIGFMPPTEVLPYPHCPERAPYQAGPGTPSPGGSTAPGGPPVGPLPDQAGGPAPAETAASPGSPAPSETAAPSGNPAPEPTS